MPLLQLPKNKKAKKKKSSTGESAAVPAGPATDQAGPAQVGKAVEVVAKAPSPTLLNLWKLICQPLQIDYGH